MSKTAELSASEQACSRALEGFQRVLGRDTRTYVQTKLSGLWSWTYAGKDGPVVVAIALGVSPKDKAVVANVSCGAYRLNGIRAKVTSRVEEFSAVINEAIGRLRDLNQDPSTKAVLQSLRVKEVVQ